MKTNKLPIHRCETPREEFVKPRGLSQNAGVRAWVIFQTVGFFLVLTLQAYGDGQETNAVAIKPGAAITKPEPPTNIDPTEIKTLDGKTYKSVRILKVTPDALAVEFTPAGGGIGMARIGFEKLPTDLQQRYGYDIEKATAYKTEQAAMQGQLIRGMEAQQAAYARECAAARFFEEDNFKGRAEIDRLENERKQAEAAQARAEAERVRIAKEDAEREAQWVARESRQNQMNQETVEQGYQIRDIWQRGR
jgi:hypothetical protein